MKKYTLFFVILSSIIFVSCESKHDQLYKACQNQDFELAHQILDKMKSDNNAYYEDDCLYLFEIESTYLLEQNSDEATKRIELLLKELPDLSFFDLNKILDNLLQKAVMVENVELIKFIVEYDYFGKGDYITTNAWNYLGEQIDDNWLTFFSDQLVDMFTSFDPIMDPIRLSGGEIYAGRRNLFIKVFDKCIEIGNYSIAKKLIDHLDSLKRMKRSFYNEDAVLSFIAFYQQKYNDAIKKKKRR